MYDHEEGVQRGVSEKRRKGVYVFAQGHHFALREAARELLLSPEHIVLGEPEPTYRVYVIECTAKTGRVTVHVGIAMNVAKRVSQHRAGKVGATKGREIVWLGNSERMTHGDALRLEAQLKKLRPVQKMEWATKQKERNTAWPS
jgi:putative endonuclease